MSAKQGIAFMVAVAVILTLAAWYEVAVWRECMADGHHWWYCLRIISK